MITNVNRLKGKKNHLAALIDTAKPHILVVTKAKLLNPIIISKILDNFYSVIRKDRNTNGDGVLVSILNTFYGYEGDLKIDMLSYLNRFK